MGTPCCVRSRMEGHTHPVHRKLLPLKGRFPTLQCPGVHFLFSQVLAALPGPQPAISVLAVPCPPPWLRSFGGFAGGFFISVKSRVPGGNSSVRPSGLRAVTCFRPNHMDGRNQRESCTLRERKGGSLLGSSCAAEIRNNFMCVCI